MFAIRSKLASFIRPWLQSESDLDLKLGFLSSHGSAQNLVFDVSALNRLIDESTCLSFKHVRVEKLSFRLSPWSALSFTVEVQGVHIALTVREPTDKVYSRSSTDWSVKEKKDILSVIDPEGTTLHSSLERISLVTPARNWFMTSLLNVALKHSRLQVHDIHLEVQLPGKDDLFAYLLKTKNLSLAALQNDSFCLLSGLVNTLFVYQDMCSLSLNCSSLELGFKRQEHISCIASSSDLFGCTKFRDLQLLDLDVHASQLDFAFSPIDLPYLLAFDKLLTKEVKGARNGRELWNIAARKIGYLALNPKLSLYKLVDSLGLWLRHVRTYESLLLLVGYPVQTIFGKSFTRMSFEKKFSVLVKNQWKAVCEIENVLPVDVLVRTRRIARHRAAMHVQCTETQSNNSESQFKVHRKLFWKLLSFLSFLLKIIWYLIKSVTHFFSAGGIANQHVESDGALEVVSGYSCSHYCFAFRSISVTISPASAGPERVNGRKETPTIISPISLCSFCVLLDSIFFIYVAGDSEQSLSFSCGDFNVISSSSYPIPLSKKNWESLRQRRKEKKNDMKVLWSDPAPKSLDPEKVLSDLSILAGNDWFLHLESHLEEIWTNWENTSRKFVSYEGQYLENPVLLCEIKNMLMDPRLLIPNCGMWKFIMSMGKLNFDLGYSSIISVSLLIWQLQHSLYQSSSNGSTGVLSHSPSIMKEPKETNLEDCYKSCVSGLKIAMLRMIPEKDIQMGVVMGGARIQMSLQEEELPSIKGHGLYHIVNQGHGDFNIALDLEDIELAVWPSLKASLPISTGEPRLADAEIEYARLKGPCPPMIPDADMS